MAPSGAKKWNERETFYTKDITYLTPHTRTEMILAGDFNCVISDEDCTGQLNHSRAIARLIQGLGLTDVCEATPNRKIYTH
jgi:exonuclease III